MSNLALAKTYAWTSTEFFCDSEHRNQSKSTKTVGCDCTLRDRRLISLSTFNKQLWLKEINKRKVNEFSRLPKGWNGPGSLAIPNSVVERALKIIDSIRIQPIDIFPTGRESIQIEYDKDEKSLEIEIGEQNIEFLSIDRDSSREWTRTDPLDIYLEIEKFHNSKLSKVDPSQ